MDQTQINEVNKFASFAETDEQKQKRDLAYHNFVIAKEKCFSVNEINNSPVSLFNNMLEKHFLRHVLPEVFSKNKNTRGAENAFSRMAIQGWHGCE